MSALTEALQKRIDACDAEVTRIAARAATDTAEQERTKAQLQAMKTTLERTPQLELLLAQAKNMGIV